MTTPRISRRRRWLFAAVTMAGVMAILTIGMLIVDVAVHWRMRDLSGINVWGFRGPTLGRKQPNETRMAMLGGSTVFGFGLRPDESVPALLERRLNERGAASGRRFSVANLGAPGQGAYSFAYDLADYAFLDYDVAILYEGYNDLGLTDVARRAVPNYFLWHRESPIFRLTGYYPLLPLVLREKGTALLQGGDVNRAEQQGQVVFRPGVAVQVAAGALNAAAAVSENLERQIGRLSENPPTPSVDEQCVPQWKQYCGAVRDAVASALARDRRVLFVTQPYASDSHVEQQANVLAMLRARFGGDSRLQFVDLGKAIDLHDRSIAFDGLHLNARGNQIVADQLVDPVLDLIR
jgi:lysophospholipase L1-like esterase